MAPHIQSSGAPHIQSSGAPEIQCKYKNITVSQLNTHYRIVSHGNDSAKRWVLSLLRKKVEVGEVRICRERRFQADGAATEKELFESWRLDHGTIKSPRDVDRSRVSVHHVKYTRQTRQFYGMLLQVVHTGFLVNVSITYCTGFNVCPKVTSVSLICNMVKTGKSH